MTDTLTPARLDEIERLAKAVYQPVKEFDDWWRADQLHSRGMDLAVKELIAALTPDTIAALVALARKGLEK